MLQVAEKLKSQEANDRNLGAKKPPNHKLKKPKAGDAEGLLVMLRMRKATKAKKLEERVARNFASAARDVKRGLWFHA